MDLIGRWGLRVPEGTDGPPDVPFWLDRLATDLANVAMDDQGTLAARPVSTVLSPGKVGRYWMVRGDADPRQNGRLWRDYGAGWGEVGAFLRASKTWNPPALNSGQSYDETLNVPGAAVGDFVVASFPMTTVLFTAPPPGVFLNARVSSADYVVVTLTNISGTSPVDLLESTLRAVVMPV